MAAGSVSVTTIYTLHYLVRAAVFGLEYTIVILSNVKKRPTAPYDTMGGTKMPTMLRTMATNVVVVTDPRAPHGLASRIKRCACTCGFFALVAGATPGAA